MSHCISGIVGSYQVLADFSASHQIHPPARLIGDIGFLPLSDEHIDQLYPDRGEYDPRMAHLCTGVMTLLVETSFHCPVALIETEYYGGLGTQSATVYDHGRCVFGPRNGENGPISEALRLLGIHVCHRYADEFESAGLHRHNCNDEWIDAAW